MIAGTSALPGEVGKESLRGLELPSFPFTCFTYRFACFLVRYLHIERNSVCELYLLKEDIDCIRRVDTERIKYVFHTAFQLRLDACLYCCRLCHVGYPFLLF